MLSWCEAQKGAWAILSQSRKRSAVQTAESRSDTLRGGSVGAVFGAVLRKVALKRKCVIPDLDGRLFEVILTAGIFQVERRISGWRYLWEITHAAEVRRTAS
jgi:hypothetical protein